MYLIKILVIFVGVLFLFFITSGSSFAENHSNFYHGENHHNSVKNHTDSKDLTLKEILEIHYYDEFNWNYEDPMVFYQIPEKWDFTDNNFLNYNFTRTWNHTMVDHVNGNNADNIHHWWTGIHLNRVGHIDTVRGLYDVELDYWVQIFDDGDDTNFSITEPEIDFVHFVNILQEPKPDYELSKGIIQKPNYHQISMAGTFHNDMLAKKWPFENVTLDFIVEPNYNYTNGFLSDNVKFHVWPYPLVKEKELKIPGFDIVGYNINVTDYKYSEGDEYSRYTASIEVERNWFSSFFKYIFPIIVMTFLAFLVMVFPRGDYMTKIELNAIFLLGIIFFVQVITEEIPSSGGLTVFDIIVLSSYSILIVTMVIPARKWLNEKELTQKVEDYEWWEKKHDQKFDRLQTEIANKQIAQALENNEEQKEKFKDEIEEREEELECFKSFKTTYADVKRTFEKMLKEKIRHSNDLEKIIKIDIEKLHKTLVKSEISEEEKVENDKIKNEIIEKYVELGCPQEEIKKTVKELEEEIKNDKVFLEKELNEFGVSEKYLSRGDWIKFLLTFEDEDESETLDKKSRNYNIIGGVVIAVIIFIGVYYINNFMNG